MCEKYVIEQRYNDTLLFLGGLSASGASVSQVEIAALQAGFTGYSSSGASESSLRLQEKGNAFQASRHIRSSSPINGECLRELDNPAWVRKYLFNNGYFLQERSTERCLGHSFGHLNPPQSHFSDLVRFPDTSVKRLALFNSTSEFKAASRDLINQLPDELLCEIFKFLPAARDRSACASVSMRWLVLQSHMHREEFKAQRENLSSSQTSSTARQESCVKSDLPEICDKAFSQGSEQHPPDPELQDIKDERGVGRQRHWANGDLSRCLEGKKATDVRLAAIAVGTGARGGLGKLCIRGGSASGYKNGVTNLGLSAIGFCCSALRSLSLWDCPHVGNEGLVAIAKGCRMLERLDVHKCPAVGDWGMHAIAANCSLLSHMSLEYCGLIGNSTLRSVGEFCLGLLSLRIGECPLVGDEGILAVILNARNLKTMKLQAIGIGDRCLAAMNQYCKELLLLSLENLDAITEAGFVSLGGAAGMQNLVQLLINSCPGLTDCALQSLGDCCKGLKHLSLGKCDRVHDQGLVAFLESVPTLEKLHMEKCNHISNAGLFVALTASNANLKDLQLKKCDGIEDGDFSLWDFHSTESLKSVCISHCRHVGNKCLASIGFTCSLVTKLDLSGLLDIGDEGLLALLKSGNRSLKSVNLCGCIKITDVAISALGKQCGKSLLRLMLDGCKMLTDKSLKVIANNCVCLQDLDISQCNVTDEGITKVLVKRGQGLISLNVSGCSNITEKILPLVEKRCKSLVGLNLNHCEGVNRKSLSRFESRLWKCDIFYT
eukprot:c28766_g1_i1 orf=346-2670(+)